MKYVWMMILGIAWIWWTVEAIKDIRYCCKHYEKYPLSCVDDPTVAWFAVHGLLVFGISLALWLMDKGLIGGG